MSPQPVYPTILRQSDWNTKKGGVAKVFKEDTGLGAQLGQLYTDFSKVEWQYWYPLAAGKLPRIQTEAELDARILPTVKHTPTVAVYAKGLHNGVRGVADGKPVLAKVAEIEAALKRLKAAQPKQRSRRLYVSRRGRWSPIASRLRWITCPGQL